MKTRKERHLHKQWPHSPTVKSRACVHCYGMWRSHWLAAVFVVESQSCRREGASTPALHTLWAELPVGAPQPCGGVRWRGWQICQSGCHPSVSHHRLRVQRAQRDTAGLLDQFVNNSIQSDAVVLLPQQAAPVKRADSATVLKKGLGQSPEQICSVQSSQ